MSWKSSRKSELSSSLAFLSLKMGKLSLVRKSDVNGPNYTGAKMRGDGWEAALLMKRWKSLPTKHWFKQSDCPFLYAHLLHHFKNSNKNISPNQMEISQLLAHQPAGQFIGGWGSNEQEVK